MGTSELLKQIYDINLSYLLLAQRIINQEKVSAMFRLGIDEAMADALARLTLPEMVKLAGLTNWFVGSASTTTSQSVA